MWKSCGFDRRSGYLSFILCSLLRSGKPCFGICRPLVQEHGRTAAGGPFYFGLLRKTPAGKNPDAPHIRGVRFPRMAWLRENAGPPSGKTHRKIHLPLVDFG